MSAMLPEIPFRSLANSLGQTRSEAEEMQKKRKKSGWKKAEREMGGSKR